MLVKSLQISSLSHRFTTSLFVGSRPPFSLQTINAFTTTTKTENAEFQLPKRPNTAFFAFKGSQLAMIKAANPQANFKELMSITGQKWKELGESQKQAYQQKYAIEKEEYDKKIASIEADPKLSEQYMQLKQDKSKARADKAHGKALKQKRAFNKETGRPKLSASSAYTVFLKENFSKNHKKGQPLSEASKLVSEQWKALSSEQKEPYIEKYKKMKEAYDSELEAWKLEVFEDEDKQDSIDSIKRKLARTNKNKRKLQKENEIPTEK